MTCIVGLVEEGRVYIGGDNAAIAGWQLSLRADSKVIHNGPFLIGSAGSARARQLLQHVWKPPLHDPSKSDLEYMVTDVAEGIRACLKGGGYAAKDNEHEKFDSAFLIGYRGQLYAVYGDYQVEIEQAAFNAIGSGAETALGAMQVTQDVEPKERIRMALCAAERFNAGVRGPFVVEVLKP